VIFAAGKKVVICGHLLSLLCLAGSKNKKKFAFLGVLCGFFKKRVANRFFFCKMTRRNRDGFAGTCPQVLISSKINKKIP